MRKVIVTADGANLAGENPVELTPEDTEVTWTFEEIPNSDDSQPSNPRSLRVKFVAFLPLDNQFPTTRVSPFTTDIFSSGQAVSRDVNAPAGLYIYVVLDEQGNLLKWSNEVFSVGTTSTFHGRFGTVIPPTGPPNTSTRNN